MAWQLQPLDPQNNWEVLLYLELLNVLKVRNFTKLRKLFLFIYAYF